MGYIIGKRVDMNEIEEYFNKSLQVPPSKPTRGIFVEQTTPSPKLIKESFSFSNDLERQAILDRSSHVADGRQNSFGRIEFVKDIKTGRLLSLDEALTGNLVDIASAVDAGFIVLDYRSKNTFKKNSNRSRSLSQSSRKTVMPRNMELNDENIIKVGRQFVITAVLDTANKVYYKACFIFKCRVLGCFFLVIVDFYRKFLTEISVSNICF